MTLAIAGPLIIALGAMQWEALFQKFPAKPHKRLKTAHHCLAKSGTLTF